MGRPVGVTIIAILCFVGAAFCVLAGIGMIAGGGFMATLLSQQSQGAGAAGILAGLGAAVGIFCLILAAIYIMVGTGLLKLKEWARIVTIVLLAIGACFQVFGLLASLAHFNIFSFIWTGFWLAVDAFLIWYLLKPEVKAAFQRPVIRAASA
ncbi:MAG: hypothetical protein ACXV5R_03895 [Candidatus Angelobacter sp.]